MQQAEKHVDGMTLREAGSTAEAERIAFEALADMPEGYTRAGVLVMESGRSYLAVAAEDLPAMALLPDGKAEWSWTRLFPSDNLPA